MRKWVVTGANGFLGRALLARLAADFGRSGHALCVGAVRHLPAEPSHGVTFSRVDDLAEESALAGLVEGADAIVHLAARVHVMRDRDSDPLSEFRRINLDATASLARAAARAGVRRFVYLSSIKVLGETTEPGQRLSADDAPSPKDPYAISKREAEDALRIVASKSRMEVVIIRPPLIYGPGVRANFLAMLQWLDKGAPLPFGAINNRRSLAGIDNVVDLIVTCLEHPLAADQAFNVTDDEDVSTSHLLRRLAVALGRRARLLPVPERLLRQLFFLAGRRDLALRVLSSLEVDVSKAKCMLGWLPRVSLDSGLQQTVAAYIKQKPGGVSLRAAD